MHVKGVACCGKLTENDPLRSRERFSMLTALLYNEFKANFIFWSVTAVVSII